jgi:hypothetical protein
VRGHHQDGPRRIVPQRRAQQVHPVDLGHAKVCDHQIDVVLSEQREACLAVFCDVDLIAVPGELRGQHPPQVGLVVDDQDLLALGGDHARKLTIK